MADPEPEGRYEETVQLGLGRFVALSKMGLVLSEGVDRVHFDEEGRLHRAWLGGRSYQRGLSGRIRAVDPQRSVGRQKPLVEVLEPSAGRALLSSVLTRLEVAAALAAAEASPALAAELSAASRWTLARYDAEQAEFDAIHAPVSILPPDQARSLVVQATLGCAWGRCSFCKLYSTQPYTVRSIEDFRAHVRAVRDFVGRALASRRGVFLGQAGALNLPYPHLAALIDTLREELGEPARWPISVFGDFFNELPTLHELRALRAQGLTGVTLGLESGSARILEKLGKPVVPSRAVELSRRIGEAGIVRGTTVLVGAGGAARAAEHAEESARVLAEMELTVTDRVYLSPLHSGRGRTPRMEAESELLRSALRAAKVPARVALYDVGRFVY